MADNKEMAPQCENEKVEATEAKQTVEKGSSPKSSPSKIETNEALQHLVQGKRHMLVRDINSAVNSLQEACRLLAEQYGETADPCGEAYFFYGKALLELSRIETGVLGNALDGVPDGDDADTSQTEDPEKLSEEEKMKVVEEVDEALEENFVMLEKANKSKQSTEDDTSTVQNGRQNGDAEMETDEKTAAKPVKDSAEAAVDEEAAGEDDARKTETKPMDEAMEVDGAAPSKAGGEADPTGLAAGDGRRRSWEIETPPAASEAKKVVAVGDDAKSVKIAGPEDVKVIEKSAAAGGGGEIEDKPILISGDSGDTRPKDGSATDNAKDISAETDRVVAVEKASGDTPAEKASGDTPAEKASGDTPAEKVSDDTPAEKASGDTRAEKVSDDTPAEKASGDIQAEKASGDTPAEKASGDTPAEKASGDTPAEKASGDTPAEKASGDTPAEKASGDTPAEKASGDTPAEKASGGTLDEKASGDTLDEKASGDTPAEKASGDTPAEKASGDTKAEKASGDTPAEKASGDTTTEKASGDTTTEKASGDTPAEKASGNAPSAEKTLELVTESTKKKVTGKKPGESTEGDGSTEGEGEEDGEEAGGEGEKQPAEGEAEEGESAKDGDTSQDCDTEEGDGEEGEGDGAKEGEDEEDVPNIQLAWEVLELAKIIFNRQAKDKQSDLKLSEVYQKLGEVSIEAENYSQAIDDLNNCLNIQKKHLEADDRLIAETHYHLGIAHSLANQYSEAIDAFQTSVDTILARVQRLQRQIIDRDQGKKIEHDDPFYKEENEIKELEDLLPDMKEKIADMRDMKSEALKKLAEVFAASGGAGPSSASPVPPISPVKAMMTSRPATSAAEGEGEKKETRSIGHLVKRKRVSNEPTDEEAKRSKQENGHNGVNGHAEPA